MRVTIATDSETRRQLKQLAAMRGETMQEALRGLLQSALKDARATERLRELQAQSGGLASL